MIAELDLYSGVPNPRWPLDAASSSALDDMLARLDVAVVEVKQPAQLGYRGVLIHADVDVFVGGGHVFIDIGPEARVLVDAGRTIERWLLASAVGHVDDRLLRGLPVIG